MNKDAIATVIAGDSQYSEELLAINGGKQFWIYKQNILDEDGNNLSWYFHPVYNKLTILYWDDDKEMFWLPKNKLYNKLLLRERIKHDNWAFFKYEYARAVIAGQDSSNVLKMSGWLPKGESFS